MAEQAPFPTLEELQHWTWVTGRAQQLILEHLAEAADRKGAAGLAPSALADPAEAAKAQVNLWEEGMAFWKKALGSVAEADALAARADKDKRFAAPEWRAHPMFDLIRQTYLLVSDQWIAGIDALEGVDEETRKRWRFAARAMLDAMAPSNFAATNPLVLQRAIETRGESLLKGLDNLMRDLAKGQLTHSDPHAFELGRNIATTPGKVVFQTPLYQIIQYAPATEEVAEVPLIIFPPWINRFYILDLNPKKSLIKWAVEQGLTVFVVSWKSADESLVHLDLDDYVLAEIEAIDKVRELLGVEQVHAVGYCVAGTMLAAALALLAARGEAGKVASATFLTAQVDFSEAGDLGLFTSDEQMKLIEQLSSDKGYLDGRYMAATFNLLRGRDLIWTYVVNHYLMGEDYPAFDLLHWNGDTTNLAARWHRAYLDLLYRGNLLVQPGGVTIDGTPVNLTRIETPAYVQAGREDHIAPPHSVWKATHHFRGDLRFVLAGSGHIAGVINPPDAGKYQYWTNEAAARTLDEFLSGAAEHKGSWWPDWRAWLARRAPKTVKAKGVRIPGKGKAKAIEDAPGSYVKAR